MFYRKNVPPFERFLRFALGAALAVSAFWIGKGPIPTFLLAGSGLSAALTGLIGFCPMCALVGRKLDRAVKGG
jgi:hypothetical protein